MGHSVTLGGERVGSGNKNKIYLHNYERSTHNLSSKFSSTMGVGMLIPFMSYLATRDDKFEIDLHAGLRTIPTKGPLFGSFKLQLDVYQCPLRLYQAILHNNPLAIGLKANQVKFPKMRLYGHAPQSDEDDFTEIAAATNSLVRYLGISGIGSAEEDTDVWRDMFASKVLAYYDIFKNYYANKQEENAYTCTSKREIRNTYWLKSPIPYFRYYTETNTTFVGLVVESGENAILTNQGSAYEANNYSALCVSFGDITNEKGVTITEDEFIKIYGETTFDLKFLVREMSPEEPEQYLTISRKLNQLVNEKANSLQNFANIKFNNNTLILEFAAYLYNNDYNGIELREAEFNIFAHEYDTPEVVLESFPLKNIDNMRMEILSFHTLGQSFLLDGEDNLPLPYTSAIGNETFHRWQEPLAGICVKTYQSDIFNNWINTEWIDGENGIAAITAISTQDGKITIDALNFSEKLYNLLNRIAVSGATYEDYLDAAYTDSAKKFCEAPMWIGGMSDEIVFEEIVQSAPAEGEPLGTLAGRGNLLGKKKGGKITCKIDEPSIIMGIVSITPRIVYTQGNDWVNTEIDSLMDIHVPALDGIAFQNLIGERLHFGSTIINENGTISERPIIGKIPAWLEYMTDVDKAYGDFAATDGDGYMVLQRDYLCENAELKDATTYIDPAKFNYAFAYTKRDAQNFWVQIHADVKARRLMSAKQIPSV